MKVKGKFSAVAAVGMLVFAGMAAPGVATAAPLGHQTQIVKAQQKGQAVRLYKLNDSTLLLKTGKGVAYDAKKKTLTQNGHVKKLPTSAKDKNGAKVKLSYVKTKKGIEVRAVSTSPYAVRSVGKCLTGVGGNALLYGGSLAGGSALACSVIPGAGTAACGIGGAIVGGVGGALTGAASNCFG